jgi:D-glycerate 3-kinase
VSDVPSIIFNVIQKQRALHPDRPVLVGVAGAQGSGKTYACQVLEAGNRPRIAHFSLDDVYLTKAERVWRADNVSSFDPYRDMDGNFQVDHKARPEIERLLLTRGPPGTHDLGLAKDVIARLKKGAPTKLPRFDKATDDRAPESAWPMFEGLAEAILIDGWCLGAKPTVLPPEPLNDVEREDEDGIWRKETETQLRKVYAPFFASFDAIVYLQAPNWEIVRRWRGQQEAQLLRRPLTAEEDAKLDRFLMFYERITRSMMAGGHTATTLVRLDEERRVLA